MGKSVVGRFTQFFLWKRGSSAGCTALFPCSDGFSDGNAGVSPCSKRSFNYIGSCDLIASFEQMPGLAILREAVALKLVLKTRQRDVRIAFNRRKRDDV